MSSSETTSRGDGEPMENKEEEKVSEEQNGSVLDSLSGEETEKEKGAPLAPLAPVESPEEAHGKENSTQVLDTPDSTEGVEGKGELETSDALSLVPEPPPAPSKEPASSSSSSSILKIESEVVQSESPKKEDESSKDEVIVLGSQKVKPLSDGEWFLKLSDEELTWYKENGPHSSYFEHKTIQCTGCSSQILNTGQDQVFRHPSLGVAICKSCKNYYQNGEWRKDDDGYDVYCRWCGNGGDLLLCDYCTHSFCKRCIQRNLGRKKLHEISEADKWQCLLCQPSLIYYQRSIYHAFVQFQCEKSLVRRKSLKKKDTSFARDTFLDENIAEAFKTLSIYQKCLEDERRRWLKCKRRMDSESAGAIARNLRKIYAITKQNMDLLDADLVQSYSESFTSCSIKDIDVNSGVEALVNQKKRKRIAPSSPVASHVDEFIVNGSPVTAEYHGAEVDEEFDPSSLLQVEFRETIAPSISLKCSPNKLSKSIGNNDSDIEVLTLDSDDESSSPQPKKRRPGPKSKTMYFD